jgi:PIN domain nuclease of toxin-antitoxin system
VIVLDTHVVIWMYSDPHKLSKAARAAVDASRRTVVSAITCWEVATLVRRQKIALDRDVGVWLRQVGTDLEVLPVDCAIASHAGQLVAGDLPGDPADRLIWATAQAIGAPLVTADRDLRRFSPGGTIW